MFDCLSRIEKLVLKSLRIKLSQIFTILVLAISYSWVLFRKGFVIIFRIFSFEKLIMIMIHVGFFESATGSSLFIFTIRHYSVKTFKYFVFSLISLMRSSRCNKDGLQGTFFYYSKESLTMTNKVVAWFKDLLFH